MIDYLSVDGGGDDGLYYHRMWYLVELLFRIEIAAELAANCSR